MQTCRSMEPAVEVLAVETFADLLFAFDSDEPASGFYGRLCEAVCRMADMDRVVIFLYDDGLRRVRAVGSYGIDLALFADAQVTADDAKQKFATDFAAAWVKVMNLDRFDLA